MIATVDSYFFTKLNKDARLAKLREFTANYVLYGDVALTLRLYDDWVRSNRSVWPFPNGRLFQPEWVQHNFDILQSLDEISKLEAHRPSLAGLPSFEQAIGEGA